MLTVSPVLMQWIYGNFCDSTGLYYLQTVPVEVACQKVKVDLESTGYIVKSVSKRMSQTTPLLTK